MWALGLSYAVAVLASGIRADLLVDVGTHVLAPDSSGQTIPIYISGGDLITGVNLNIQIEDGFPDVPTSSLDGPNIEAVDLVGDISATIFTGNNTGQQDPGGGLQLAFRSLTTPFGSTAAGDGLLATVTLDTTGLYEGTFLLSLGATVVGVTEFLDDKAAPIPATIHDGAIVIQAATVHVLGGVVRYWSNAARLIDGGDGELQVDGNLITNKSWGIDGQFVIEIETSGSVSFSPLLLGHDKASAGVDIEDILAIRKHVLNRERIANPFGIIAADVNRDNAVDVGDLIEMRKVILKRENWFSLLPDQSPAPVWRFFRADLSFSNPDDPFEQVASDDSGETLAVENVTSDLVDLNWFGVKLGDVNGDWVP